MTILASRTTVPTNIIVSHHRISFLHMYITPMNESWALKSWLNLIQTNLFESGSLSKLTQMATMDFSACLPALKVEIVALDWLITSCNSRTLGNVANRQMVGSDCWEELSVSSCYYSKHKLTDGLSSTYWESSGDVGKNWIHLKMKSRTVIRLESHSTEHWVKVTLYLSVVLYGEH